MIVREQTGGMAALVAVFLAGALVVSVVGAGFLWLREADQRLQAEQELASLQQKYDQLQAQCDAMKGGGQTQGLSLDVQQNPVVAGLAKQTELPQCEKPSVQPVTAQMMAQDKQFFANAKEGDALVSYPSTKIVYLYRPDSETLLNQARLAGPPAIAPPQAMAP